MRLTNVGSNTLNRLRRCPTRCAHPVWTKPRGQEGRPTATPHHGYPHCTPQAAHGHCRARNDMAATQRRYRRQRQRWVTARAHIARACLGLVLQSCLRVPLECMQGGSHWPGPAVEPERAQRHDPVLGRWRGLTPERPALCRRGEPRRSRVDLSRVSDPPGLGRL